MLFARFLAENDLLVHPELDVPVTVPSLDLPAMRTWNGQQYEEKKGDVLVDPEQESVPVRDRSDLDGPARDIQHVPVSEIAAGRRNC